VTVNDVVMANIPGSRVPRYMAGARLEAHFPLSASQAELLALVPHA
jgi:hypothetical protein